MRTPQDATVGTTESPSPSIKEPVKRLRQVLELEKSKGFQDNAVIGGLDKFLSRWTPELQQFEPLLPLLRQVEGLTYRSWSVGPRRRWLEEVLAELGTEGETPSGRQASPQRQRSAEASLEAPITSLRGMGPQLASKFLHLGVHTIRDLLYFFPRRHHDFSRRVPIAGLRPGEEQTTVGTVWEAHERVLPTGRRAVEAVLGDETGNVVAIWFGKRSYLLRQLAPDTQLVLSGKVTVFRGRPQFEEPEYELMDQDYLKLVHTGRLVPVYPSTEGLSPRLIRRVVKSEVDRWAPGVPELLPDTIRAEAGFLPRPDALQQAHYPDSEAAKEEARRRLAFDEIFLLQLGVLARKREWQEGGRWERPPMKVESAVVDAFLRSLPFRLTRAQERALADITRELVQPRPMGRLLQGEVGSGKTVVALAALVMTAANHYQGALMAPTEILAEQHFQTVSQLTADLPRPVQEDNYFAFYLPPLPRPLGVGLLTGSQRSKEKKRLQQLLREGILDILIGTHALIQERVEFHQLGLTVVDEQQRFGVEQRHALQQKGYHPHLLAMTATPIPRTLALTLYGDLDISVLDELPQGQRLVKTLRLRPAQRPRAYEFLRQQIDQGHQAFVICPLIQESEALEVKAATTEFERLCTEVFPDLAKTIGLLHGRLPAEEKNRVMRRFRSGELAVLVSTPVVEVGIDVPNATVMLIEGADRFGLAQLHQLRGRVGRGGQAESWVLLLSESPSQETQERLAILERTNDGFLLAEKDLELRGPGEFLGARQSGWPELKMARLSDLPLLELARGEARKLLQLDPHLSQPQHRLLKLEVARMWPQGGTEIS